MEWAIPLLEALISLPIQFTLGAKWPGTAPPAYCLARNRLHSQ